MPVFTVGAARSLALAIAGLGIAGFPVSGLAGDWAYTAEVTEQIEYDDNIRLEIVSDGHVIGNRITPALSISNTSPTLEFEFNAELEHEVFDGPGADGTLERLDPAFGLSGSKSWPQTTLSVSGLLTRQATRVSEFEDTGVTAVDTTRETRSLTASISHRFLRRDEFSLSSGVSDVDFDDVGAFTPSTTYDVSAGWTHDLSPVSNVGIGLSASFFQPEGPSTNVDSQTYRVSANHSRQHSERFSTFGGIGVTITQEGDPGGSLDSASFGFLIDAGLMYIWPTSTLTLDLNQDVNPSAAGELQQSRTISFGFDHRLTREINFGLSANYFSRFNDESPISVSDSDRDYVSVEPSLSWQLTPNASLSFSYRLRYEDDEADGTALSNAVFFGVTMNRTFNP